MTYTFNHITTKTADNSSSTHLWSLKMSTRKFWLMAGNILKSCFSFSLVAQSFSNISGSLFKSCFSCKAISSDIISLSDTFFFNFEWSNDPVRVAFQVLLRSSVIFCLFSEMIFVLNYQDQYAQPGKDLQKQYQ